MNYQTPDHEFHERAGMVTVQRLDTPEGLSALVPAWERLAEGTAGAFHPAYVQAAWTSGLCPGDLCILAAHRGGKLVAVWPLYAARSKGLSVLRHLGNGSREEYAGPLLAPDEQPEPILSALWDAVRRHGDLVEIYNLRDDSAAYRFFRDLPAGKFVSSAGCPVIHTASVPWDQWLAAKSKKFRNDLKQNRKPLVKKATITFRRIPAAEAERHARWCVQTKRLWLDTHKIDESWLRDDAVIAFYASLMDRAAGVEGFAMEADGEPIAGAICTVGAGVCEYFLTVIDEEWRDYSPGMLLIEDLARWCSEQGLDFDFRFPVFDYKLRWADEQRTVHTMALALTGRSSVELARRRLSTLKLKLRRAVKTALTRLKTLKPSTK